MENNSSIKTNLFAVNRKELEKGYMTDLDLFSRVKVIACDILRNNEIVMIDESKFATITQNGLPGMILCYDKSPVLFMSERPEFNRANGTLEWMYHVIEDNTVVYKTQ